MPIIKAGSQLLYYAHVPKCGGSSVENYLRHRFGQIAFLNKRHTSKPKERRWSQTSPQHVDLVTLSELFPAGFFDHSFAVVRHPAKRLISAYHFQLEVERSAPANMRFTFWLETLAETGIDRFVYDNHTRPMTDLVPEDAKSFHLEHGVDAIVPWLDELTGSKDAPRTIGNDNVRKSKRGKNEITEISKEDIRLIAKLYASDFERFNYEPDRWLPLVNPPDLDEAYLKSRDRELELSAKLSARSARLLRRCINRIKN